MHDGSWKRCGHPSYGLPSAVPYVVLLTVKAHDIHNYCVRWLREMGHYTARHRAAAMACGHAMTTLEVVPSYVLQFTALILHVLCKPDGPHFTLRTAFDACAHLVHPQCLNAASSATTARLDLPQLRLRLAWRDVAELSKTSQTRAARLTMGPPPHSFHGRAGAMSDARDSSRRWAGARIRLRCGKSDAKKAKIYGRVGKKIVSVVKAGGADPSVNIKLADLLRVAKDLGVPREILDRNISRASDKNQV
ncbi:transcriptional regulatory protein [Haematococcus lacustris]|uniref:Transcriptional regulatory protein n=1 Tax=Haematococcus lacustris TaxID=44745 RepID=A0A699ZDM9_HAELA|nr:transcriptional regulatory protein [Haematococcus lacustris]